MRGVLDVCLKKRAVLMKRALRNRRTWSLPTLLVSGVLCSSLASAVTTDLQTKPQEDQSYAVSYTTLLTTNAYSVDRPEHQSSQDHLLGGALYFADGSSLSTNFWLNQDFNNERELLTRDSLLTWSKSLGALTDNVSFAGKAAVTLPLSEVSYKTAGLLTAFRVIPVVAVNMNQWVPGMSLVYQPAFIVNFHKYQTATSGSSNNQYSFSQRLTVYVSIVKSVSLTLDHTYVRSWTYLGSVSDFFSLDQSLGAKISERLSLFVGHSIGGGALAANGQESNIRIFDTKDSNYYLGMSYQF